MIRHLVNRIARLLVVAIFAYTGFTGIQAVNASFNDQETSTNNSLQVVSSWYDLDWYWRRPVTITNSGGALTDCQVLVTLDTAALVTAGKMKSDGSDIRFAGSDGYTNLSYWIESGMNTASTSIWVKVPSIPSGNSTVYIYYSNPAAAAASSVAGTFINSSFQDLFNDDTKVDGSASLQVTVGDGEVTLDVDTIEMEDQSQVLTDGANTLRVFGTNAFAQTFTAGLNGTVSKITIRAGKNGSPPNALTVELRNVTGGQPGSTVYASASRADIAGYTDYEYTFASAPSITAGTQYSIVVYTSGGGTSNRYDVGYSTTDEYAAGQKFDSSDGGNSWTAASGQDLYFRTYANTGWDLDQSQISSNHYDEVYGDNWSAQSFLAGLTGQLRKIAIQVARYGSPPNALVVEVRDAVAVSGEQLDQSQTSHNSTRQVYGDNYAGQTFRAGTDGDLTRVTLRVSKTGSPGSGLIVELRDVVVTYQDTIDQSQTLYTGDRQLYGDNWRSQVFEAGLSGDLGKVYLRASKTGTPPNDLTVELRDAVEVNEELLDQSHTITSTSRRIRSNNWTSQTFTAGISGTLTTVALRLSKTGSPPNALTVELRNCTVDDLPGSTIYATASRSDIGSEAEYNFTFPSPPSVTASVKYALVIYTVAGSNPNRYNVFYNNSDTYSAGRECVSYDTGSSWTGQTTDLYFKTYVTVANDAPGDSVLATTSRGDISTAGEYEFSFGTMYAVTSGTKYALVVYTTLGDVSNYYSVSYQNTDVYANGRELASSNGGTSWTGSATDLYFKTCITTLVGDTPGSTVYATASRNDITTAGEYEFEFSSPYTVSYETNYAMVIYTDSGDASNYYSVSYQASDVYALGKLNTSADGGSNWTPDEDADLYFKTYVTIATGYVPGTTVYATSSRSEVGTSQGKVEFLFSSPVTITADTRYTIVVKTTGGSIDANYRVYSQNTNVYSNGNESYTVDGGTNWVAVSSNDMWFQVYVDESSTGVARSVTIPVDSNQRFAVGTLLSWSDTQPANTEITYQVEYKSGESWLLVPDSVLPGNSSGFDTSGVDISSVTTAYGQIRLRANLSSTDSSAVPSIQDWTVTYYARVNADPGTSVGSEQ